MTRFCKVDYVTEEYECSRFTPGAEWVYGGEYYAVTGFYCVPTAIARSEREAAIEDWFEWLNSRGFDDCTD